MMKTERKKLNTIELDRVTGGSAAETAEDSRFFSCLNSSIERYGAFRVFWEGESFLKRVNRCWADVGIESNVHSALATSNTYKLNGRRISQEEAWKHAMSVTGHFMSIGSWNW